MEPNKLRKRTVFIGVLATFLAIFYFLHLTAKLNAAENQLQMQEKETERLSNIAISGARQINDEFISKFFTYTSTKSRYEGIQEIMTDQGYKSTFPSGMELPENDLSIHSEMEGLKSYEHMISKTQAEFFNEFNVTIEVRNNVNKQTVIVRTFLIYSKENGWKINDVEYIGQLTTR